MSSCARRRRRRRAARARQGTWWQRGGDVVEQRPSGHAGIAVRVGHRDTCRSSVIQASTTRPCDRRSAQLLVGQPGSAPPARPMVRVRPRASRPLRSATASARASEGRRVDGRAPHPTTGATVGVPTRDHRRLVGGQQWLGARSPVPAARWRAGPPVLLAHGAGPGPSHPFMAGLRRPYSPTAGFRSPPSTTRMCRGSQGTRSGRATSRCPWPRPRLRGGATRGAAVPGRQVDGGPGGIPPRRRPLRVGCSSGTPWWRWVRTHPATPTT